MASKPRWTRVESVHSIELAPHLYEQCRERFRGDPRVHLYLGDSAERIGEVAAPLDGPITYWLDGHYSCGVTVKGPKWSPLMDELEVISRYPDTADTILIDDMRCWHRENPEFGFGEEDIREAVLRINPEYEISFEDGHGDAGETDDLKNDILVARVPC